MAQRTCYLLIDLWMLDHKAVLDNDVISCYGDIKYAGCVRVYEYVCASVRVCVCVCVLDTCMYKLFTQKRPLSTQVTSLSSRNKA